MLLLLAGCQEYYLPPPPVAVSISPSPSLASNFVNVPLAVLNSSTNQIETGTQQFTATVVNTGNTNVTWSIIDPRTGVALPNGVAPDGTAPFGLIDSTGLYTAPTAMPAVNTFAVQATSVADKTQSAQVGVELVAPTATVSSVTITDAASGNTVPAMIQGGSYVLDIKGQFLYPTSVVKLSGGSVGAVQAPANAPLPLDEIKVPVTITAAGLTPLLVVNPTSTPGNPFALVTEPVSPAATSAMAVIIEPVVLPGASAPVLVDKIYVPQASGDALAIMDGETGTRLRDRNNLPALVQLPVGFAPTMAAANPASDQVIALSTSGSQLAVVDALHDTVSQIYALPVTQTVAFSDETCGVCAALVDTRRDEAILSTANGFFTVNLATGATSSPIAAPTSENFAYDPNTQRIYAPFHGASGSGLNVIDLSSGAVYSYQLAAAAGFSLGSDLSAAALDPSTLFAVLGDFGSSEYVGINFNGAQPSQNFISAPAAQFQISAACGGGWDGVAIEPGSHFGFFGNQGACLGVASLPSAPASGTLGLANQNIRWAQIGLSPDGIAWTNLAEPHGETVFVGLNGTVYGLGLRQDQGMLVRVDLAALQAAPHLAGGADANQADISTTPSPVVFMPLH
ncbi:MAG TPA: hypothetical protein VE996_09680 [Terriglobales bacterium]|nr:hypothetical protein [Terriglobales bacterium]